MAYAIIRTGGKQYRVNEGDCLKVEKLDAEVGAEVSFDDVLALGEGASLATGADAEGKAVKGEVVSQGRDKKIRIWNFKRRKGYNRRMGHRQSYTEVKITSIPA